MLPLLLLDGASPNDADKDWYVLLLPEIGTGLRAAGENVPEGNPGAAGTGPPAAEGGVGECPPPGDPRPELAAGTTPSVARAAGGGGGCGDTVGEGGGSEGDVADTETDAADELETGDGVARAGGVGVGGGCSDGK